MKKRILAMLLVLCLVMSVMPMTVLAAEANCPGKTKDHTLENCDATLVIHVPAENCSQKDYDLFKCNKCGVLFADNFGAYGPHNLVLIDEEVPALECGVGLYCNVNGCYAYDWDKYQPYTIDHDFDCYGKCVCGEEGEAGHNWDQKLIEITKEPQGCAVPGEATYTCADCGKTKIAPVYGKHIEKKAVAGVAPECDKTGLLPHEYCSACGSYWIDGVEVEKEDVILAPAHTGLAGNHYSQLIGAGANTHKVTVTADSKVIIEIPANTIVRIAHRENDGSVEYFVGNVIADKEPVVKIFDLEADEYINIHNPNAATTDVVVKISVLDWEKDIELWVDPTCGGYGIYQVYCNELKDEYGNIIQKGCGELVTVQTTMVAHNWVLDEYRSQPASCDKFGYEFWICDDCGEAKPVKMIPKLPCVDTWIEVLANNKGKEEGEKGWIDCYEELPTCTQKGYRTWACPTCGEVFEQTLKATGCKLAIGTFAATKCTEGYVYQYCTNENCDNDAAHTDYNKTVSAIVGKDVHKVTSVLKPSKLADHAWVLDSTSATCTEAGYELYTCICGEYKLVSVKAYGHSGYDTIKDNEIPDLVVVEATCTSKGYSYYVCADCGVQVFVTKDVPFVHKALMSEAEVEKYHGEVVAFIGGKEVAWEDLTWDMWTVVPTCKKVGYINVECKDCLLNERKHSITVYAGGSHAVDYTKLDCNGAICPICGELVKGTDHNWSVPGVKGDCYTDGYEGYGKCSICGAEREQGTIIYAGHYWSNDKAIKGDCDSWAGQPMTCTRGCDSTIIVEYVPNLHYVGEGGTVVKNNEKSDKFDACMESGTEVYNCTVKGCDYAYEVEVTGLGYHVNWDGYKIDYSACPDCNKAANNLGDDYFWHPYRGSYSCKHCGKYLENLGMDASCTEDGYYVYAFTCGHSGYLQHQKALGHLWSATREVSKNGLYEAYQCIRTEWVWDDDLSDWIEVDCCDAEKDPRTLNNVAIRINNDLGKYEVLHDGATVEITVSLEAFSADLFGYAFDLNYDPSVLQFVDFEPLSDMLPYNANVNPGVEIVTPAVLDKDGKVVTPAVLRHYVRIMGQKAADGKNATLIGTENLVTLTFKVVSDKKVNTNLTVDNLEIYKNIVIDKKTYLSGVECINPTQNHVLSASMLMDANNDGVVDYLDCATVWQLYSGVLAYEYRENLDLNHNGEIDHVDANLIYKYFAGYITYDEVLNYEA